MVIKNVNLETVCGITSKIPDNPFDEIAFAGKSNVGKSSLINALMNRRSLARTSSQPGKTRTINFYNVNGCMYLVDLPGYGYAGAGVEIKAKWGQMIEHYLHTSKRLRAVFLLIDIRHEPSENDRMMYDWITAKGYEPIIIATKADKLRRSQEAVHVRMIREALSMAPQTAVIPFSSVTRQGREAIWEEIELLCGFSGAAPQESTDDRPAAAAPGPQENAGESRKPRWKKTGRPVAKKTAKKRRNGKR